jgi:hypothetical protein
MDIGSFIVGMLVGAMAVTIYGAYLALKKKSEEN